eukprot:1551201-Rhodomonas_salina.1
MGRLLHRGTSRQTLTRESTMTSSSIDSGRICSAVVFTLGGRCRSQRLSQEVIERMEKLTGKKA